MAVRTLAELGLALVAGAAAGVLGSYAQQYAIGGAPVGAVLGVLLAGCVTVAVRLGLGSRSAAVAATVGWFVVVTLASLPRREGDLLLPGDARGWGYLVGGSLVLGLGAVVPHRPAAAAP